MPDYGPGHRTVDEVRRLDETAAVVIVKGLAPILAQKLGSPAREIIDLATPRIRKVAAVAGAFILVAGVTTWALWPSAQAKPSLSLTPLAWVPPGAVEPPPQPAQTPQAIRDT